MSKMIAEVYEAFKAAGVPDDKAKEAAKAITELGQEDRLAKIEGDIKVIKWMLGMVMTMNVGIILMLIKMFSVFPK